VTAEAALPPTGPRHRVELRAAPVVAVLDLLAALDGLHREVQLADIGEAGPSAGPGLEADVVAGFVTDRAGLEAERHAIHEQARLARDAGCTVADIVVDYASEQVEQVHHAAEAVARADAAARAGMLLVPPLDPRQRHLWQWMHEQVRIQMAGGPPTAYAPPR
jgi:hypothetical protein